MKELFRVSNKKTKECIKERRKEIDELIDGASESLVIITDEGNVVTGNKVSIMASFSATFENLMKKGLFTREDIEYMAKIAEEEMLKENK